MQCFYWTGMLLNVVHGQVQKNWLPNHSTLIHYDCMKCVEVVPCLQQIFSRLNGSDCYNVKLWHNKIARLQQQQLNRCLLSNCPPNLLWRKLRRKNSRLWRDQTKVKIWKVCAVKTPIINFNHSQQKTKSQSLISLFRTQSSAQRCQGSFRRASVGFDGSIVSKRNF